MTTIVRPDKSIDACRARGCGGYLREVGTTVLDGEDAYCMKCGRMHTFVVFGDSDDPNENDVGVRIERKPRPRKP